MTIFNLLKSDHRRLRSMLRKLDRVYDQTSERQWENQVKLFDRFKLEISSHTKAEESAVYKSLKEDSSTRDFGLEGFEEHHLVDYMIETLETLSPLDEEWSAKIKVLRHLVEEHVRMEETKMFDQMKETFEPAELDSMFHEMRMSRKEKDRSTQIRNLSEYGSRNRREEVELYEKRN